MFEKVEAKFTAIPVAVTSSYWIFISGSSRARALINSPLRCRGLNTLDLIVYLPSVVAINENLQHLAHRGSLF